MLVNQQKTWSEINKKAIIYNVKTFQSLINKKTKIFAVVKSNAYGHGLVAFSKVIDKTNVYGFCVDDIKEGETLRNSGINKPVLVLGPTLPSLLKRACASNLIITISNKDALDAYLKSVNKPQFHLKIDSGMHRQGFYSENISKIINSLKKIENNFKGVYTHFCSAKDINHPTYTEFQFKEFKKVLAIFKKTGFKKIIKHAASTGAVLINKKYHLDAVRIGIGFYGLYPSKELDIQLSKLKLKPILSWHVRISELKNIKKGNYIGYDLIERASKNIRAAVLPIGYWHGFSRSLSSKGIVLVNSKRVKVLGMVSMDLIIVDVTGIKCKVSDKATIIGKQGSEIISVFDVAAQIHTSHYELITRINPLIERIVV
ncbi:alanine racemase [Patescibacteria group bacterium]|nr:alanine racemase [Patescibacteria group bacterium]